MSMNANRFCPNCGSPADPGQRFCANCGSAINVTTVNPDPTEFKQGASAPDLGAFPPSQEPVSPSYTPGSPISLPPPPPPDLFQSTTMANYSTPQPPPPYQPVPDFARPQKGATAKAGMGLLLIILIIVVVLVVAAGGTYFYFQGKNGSTSQNANNGGNTSTTSTSNTSTTPTPTTTLSAGTVTFSPALSYIYANVKVSILDVKQADTFSDDSGYYSNPGVLRLDIKEESQTIDGGYYNYSYDALRLVRAGGTTLQPHSEEVGASIDTNVSRTNWIDFATSGTLDVNQLTLHVGADNEAQMDIPLKKNADLTKYQPKTYNVNQTASSKYGFLTWTITKVVVSYSALGSQATKGMIYVIISSRVDNNSSQYSFNSVGDNMRLKSGDTSSAPVRNTLPGSANPQQTNITGNTIFLMPQGSTNFTCTVISDGSGTADTTIQLQLS